MVVRQLPGRAQNQLIHIWRDVSIDADVTVA
jgi:hypothetical protein